MKIYIVKKPFVKNRIQLTGWHGDLRTSTLA